MTDADHSVLTISVSLMGNIWARVFKSRDVRILLCGLDAAGKTTLLYRIKLGEVIDAAPSIGFNVETIQHKNIRFTAWDIGCREKMRPLIRFYYKGTDAVIFVLDRSDEERMDELYHDILLPANLSHELDQAVYLILANKSDLNDVMSMEDITEKLRLNQLKRVWNLFPVSAITGEGIEEAFDWLVSQLGSTQSKKPASGAVTQDTRNQTQKFTYGMEQCTRAFSSLKWLFMKSNSQESVTDVEEDGANAT